MLRKQWHIYHANGDKKSLAKHRTEWPFYMYGYGRCYKIKTARYQAVYFLLKTVFITIIML